jgi:acetyltransferase-like isoleucine patch superfamily enzyme
VGEVPEFAIAAGIPAKVMRDRRETGDGRRETEPSTPSSPQASKP